MGAPRSKVEIRLNEDQRAGLEWLVQPCAHPAHATRRGRILLTADAGGPPTGGARDLSPYGRLCRENTDRRLCGVLSATLAWAPATRVLTPRPAKETPLPY
jgi:hypothetical protein